jgi:hypothetical protein
MSSITQYLSKTNVQLGASYHTGSQSNTKYEQGYQAAAKYMNAGRDEIGNRTPNISNILLLITTSSRCFNNPAFHEPRLLATISLWL